MIAKIEWFGLAIFASIFIVLGVVVSSQNREISDLKKQVSAAKIAQSKKKVDDLHPRIRHAVERFTKSIQEYQEAKKNLEKLL